MDISIRRSVQAAYMANTSHSDVAWNLILVEFSNHDDDRIDPDEKDTRKRGSNGGYILGYYI